MSFQTRKTLFGAQIKICLMNSDSSLTLPETAMDYNDHRPETLEIGKSGVQPLFN